MTTPSVGNVIGRGGESAQTMAEEPVSAAAQRASAFDVWSHSYDGMTSSMQAAAQNPSAFLASSPTQLANMQAASLNMSPSSLSQVSGSMSAQASALGNSVNAVGEAQGALQTVGATFAMLTGVEQMLSTVLSAIPFPSFPALRIADMDIGLPHAHSHPPNLVPPAPPVPLPSMGPVIPIPILSGATSTLINGMPAGRCGDMGLGVWCGGYFPMYEVFLGSSNVWIEGARAARMLVDITKHCMFTVPKPSDPPLGPMIGTTISASPNVLIGGVPMPSLTSLAFGAAMKGVFKLAGKGAGAFARLTAPLRRRLGANLDSGFLKCKILRAEPVNFVTGEVTVDQQDFQLPGRIPISWSRHYRSQSTRKGLCGFGWSTPADARLVFEEDGAVLFYDGVSGPKIFPYLPEQGGVQEFVDGATLESVGDTLRVRPKGGLTYVFARGQASELLVRQVEDRCGNHLRYVRDDYGGLSEIVESAGRRIVVKSRDGLIREMWLRQAEHEPAHLLVRYEYSEAAELLAVFDALEHPYRFRYEHRRLVQHTDRNGLSFYYAYENKRQSARCHHAWGDGGLYNYHFEFDPAARRISVKDSLGAVSSIQLNDLNLPAWEIDPLGGITRYEYDDRGRTVSVIDQDGHRTGYEYDDRGNLTKVTVPGSKGIETTFNADNLPVAIKDPSGGQWAQIWDARGLLVEQITPLGHVSRYEYDTHGQVTAFISPRAARTELGFDQLGNLSSLKDACGNSTRFAYDSRGNLTAKVDALGRKTLYRYDATNRLTSIRLPSGASIRCAHDPQGNLVRYVDQNGTETRFEYVGQGEIARRIQPDGHSVQYHYDTEERLIGITNQRGEQYRLKRDALGRLIEEVDYWGQSRQYKLSPGGHLLESIDSVGNKSTYLTDPLGRVLRKVTPDVRVPGKVFEEFFEYDASGNLVTAENPYIKIQRRFDAEGRLLEEKQGEQLTIRNAYDAAGNRIARETEYKHERVGAGHRVSYTYDALDRPIEIAVDQHKPIRIVRNALGQIVSEQLNPSLLRELEYSADGYLTRRRLRAGLKDVIDVRYAYDPIGHLTERNDAGLGLDRFVYDPLGRVVQHIDPAGALEQYLSDPAGDLLHTRVRQQPVAVAGADGEWSREGSYGGAFYRFDRAGNLIRRHDERGELMLVWDADQRLVESRRNGVSTTYGYDPLGRRLFKATGSQKTSFYWDGDALLSEATLHTDAQAAQSEQRPAGASEYLYYPGTFEPLLRIDTRAGERADNLYYHNDPNGCPLKITDERGSVKWAVSYRVWGEVSRQHANLVDNSLRLQGQYFDSETGLHYNRHRYYDPRTGQFVSPDPLGLAAGENLFAFGRNPFSWIDPSGLKCENTWNAFQRQHKGRFRTPAEAAAAYWELVNKQSPWPIGHVPAARVLPPGTRIKMAMSPGQASTRPGGFATFDDVPDVPYVRNELAVKEAWKPDIDRVVTYEVTQPLPVKYGPVGPQVDKGAGAYLPGGGSQVEMTVPPADRMNYLQVVDETPIT